MHPTVHPQFDEFFFHEAAVSFQPSAKAFTES
jgi:hypothetical protein